MKKFRIGVGLFLAVLCVLSGIALLCSAVAESNWVAIGVFITAGAAVIAVLLMWEDCKCF
jgi:hypothetical protein